MQDNGDPKFTFGDFAWQHLSKVLQEALRGSVTFSSISVTIYSVSTFESEAFAVQWQVPLTVCLELKRTMISFCQLLPKLTLGYQYEASRSWIQPITGRKSDCRWLALCEESGTKIKESADMNIKFKGASEWTLDIWFHLTTLSADPA